MQTEFEFTLPRGYVDPSGTIHRHGSMRLSTALDEIEACQDPRVKANEAYLPIVILSRVLLRLGSLQPVSPQVLEGLYATDFIYLEDLYQRINSPEQLSLGVICPQCSTLFQVQVAPIENQRMEHEA